MIKKKKKNIVKQEKCQVSKAIKPPIDNPNEFIKIWK